MTNLEYGSQTFLQHTDEPKFPMLGVKNNVSAQSNLEYVANEVPGQVGVVGAFLFKSYSLTKIFGITGKEEASMTDSSTLKFGSQGKSVARLQRNLNALGENLAVDGDYGHATDLAVGRFQAAHKLSVTGEVDPKTLTALEWAVSDMVTTKRNQPKEKFTMDRVKSIFASRTVWANVFALVAALWPGATFLAGANPEMAAGIASQVIAAGALVASTFFRARAIKKLSTAPTA